MTIASLLSALQTQGAPVKMTFSGGDRLTADIQIKRREHVLRRTEMRRRWNKTRT